MKNIIGFWKPADRNGYLSQWWKCTFSDESHIYNCAEQYMMAQKAILFGDNAVLEKIMKETNPANIKKYGREIKNFDESTWDDNKFEIVCEGNRLKFSQNPSLKKQLLGTLDATLVEASPMIEYGELELKIIWMKMLGKVKTYLERQVVREELR